MIIEINLFKVNLSSLVKKWDKINAIIGATDSKRPAVFDCIYISAQLIKLKGIKFPINPINPINPTNLTNLTNIHRLNNRYNSSYMMSNTKIPLLFEIVLLPQSFI